MSFGFLGCNPEQTWAKESEAPRVGTRGQGGGGEYILLQAGEAIGAHDVCVIAADGDMEKITKAKYDATKERLVVPQTAIASGSYGWGLIEGQGMINALPSCAADAQLYTSATAGALDDAAASQTAVNGIRLLKARGATPTGSSPALALLVTPRGV